MAFDASPFPTSNLATSELIRFIRAIRTNAKASIYHINAVDEVTQFQIIVTLAQINEEHMLPALKQLLDTFPFEARGFHANKGGECIHYSVAERLEKLRIDFHSITPPPQ